MAGRRHVAKPALGPNQVAAASLGPIQDLVGPLQQAVRGIIPNHDRQADSDRDPGRTWGLLLDC
jgi:hypothetical protein